MSNKQKSVTFLEGLGYTAALMIGAAGLTEEQALRCFNVAGLVFGLIAIVRLLAMNIKAGRPAPGLTPLPPRLPNDAASDGEESQEDGTPSPVAFKFDSVGTGEG